MRLHMICTAAILGCGVAEAQFTSPVKAKSPRPVTTVVAPTGGSFSGGGANCAAAVTVGTGPTVANFPFDNTMAASMGVGTNPFEQLCNYFGNTGIDNEEWFVWTAASNGLARLSTCTGISGVDTKIAIYADNCAGITTLDPIACKDDDGNCPMLETTIVWPIAMGTSYRIQLGTFVGAAGGAADFSIEELAPLPPGTIDTGTSNNVGVSLVAGGDVVYLNVLNAGLGATVDSVDIAYGDIGAVTPPDGTAVTVVVYQGDPVNGLTLVGSQATISANSGTGMFNNVVMTNPPCVSGLYTVGWVINHVPGEFPGAMDGTVNSLGRAYVAGEPGGTFDINDPSIAALAPVEMDALNTALADVSGVWLIRANTSPASCGTTFAEACDGDGGDGMGCTACPCGNEAPVGTIGGCLNSNGTSGRLIGSGSPSVSAADPTDLRFDAEGLVPASFCVLTSGAAIAPANAANPCFGLDSGVQSSVLDGLRCAVQNTQRHGGRPVDALGNVGVTTNGWGGASGPPAGLAAQGGFVAGQTRHYQGFYRELPGLVCLTEQNTTQAVTVTFVP